MLTLNILKIKNRKSPICPFKNKKMIYTEKLNMTETSQNICGNNYIQGWELQKEILS